MKNENKNNSSYLDAGVNIEAGNSLVERIKPLAKATARIGSDNDLGGFGGLFDLKKTGYKDPVLVSGTDGVGTKLKIAQTLDKHDTIGIDLVAMCVNDIVVQGAEPLFFLDYFACGKLDINVAEDVIKGIADGCKKSGCALIGGETAEMPGMYQDGEYDLAGFSVGAVERDEILPKQNISEGDIIVGIESSGIHSNGYSLVRKIISDNNLDYDSKPLNSEKTIGEILLEPTTLYVKTCLELMKSLPVKAFAHITGGGITENLPRVLSDNISAKIDPKSWQRKEIFNWLQEAGNVTDEEMLKTFNCGVGMIAVIKKENLQEATDIITRHNLKSWQIGEIINGNNSVIYV
jgi:phosphoribosylformylglycinamidine cyclo-ligase